MKAKVLPPIDYLRPRIKLCRRLSIVSYFALLVLFTLWYLIIHPVDTANPWVIWLLHFLPIAAFIKTVQRGDPRGHAWLCFMLILYFNEAVLAATTVLDTRLFGSIYTLIVVVLFVSAMMYARWAGQYRRHPDNPVNAGVDNA
ncbi:MAG: DUF2069 domain-containing protein [Pseudomonadales bacterium]